MPILIVGVKYGARYRLPLEEQKSPCMDAMQGERITVK